MSLRKRALRGATWAVAGGNASQVLSFAMFVAISRQVGPEAFGAVAIAIAIIEMCRPIASEAVVGNLVASGRLDARLFNAGFFISVGAAVILCAALILAAPVFAALFRTPALVTVLPQISLLLLFYAASRVQEAYLTLELRFDSLAIRSVAAALIGGSVGIAAAYSGLGVTALVLQQWAGAVVSLVLVWGACAWRPSFSFSREESRNLVRSSAALAPAGLLAQLTMLTDALAVASFSGPLAAGLYNLGKRTRLALQLGLASALDRVSLPAFANVRGDTRQLARTLTTALRLSTIIAFPVFIGVAAVAPELIGLFLGPEWMPAAAPMALLLIAGAVSMTTHFFDNVLLILERRKWIVTLRLAMLAVLVVLLILFGHQGATAVAACALAATALHNVGAFYAVYRHAPVRAVVYRQSILLPLAISLTMLGLLTFLRGASMEGFGPALRLPLLVALGATFYLGVCWFAARRTFQEFVRAARSVLGA